MLKKSKLFYVLLIALISIGCHQVSTTVPAFSNSNRVENSSLVHGGNEFNLEVNQIANLDGENLTVQFVGIESDSRCPTGLRCFWQGQVKATVSIGQNGEDLGKFTLIKAVGQSSSAIATVAGYEIKLLDVSPYPQQNSQPDVADYVVTLTISPKS